MACEKYKKQIKTIDSQISSKPNDENLIKKLRTAKDKLQLCLQDLKNKAAKAGMDVDKYKASKKIKPKKTGGFRDPFLEAPIEEI